MNITVLQAPFPESESPTAARQCQEWMQARLDELHTGEHDLIVLPEYMLTPNLNTSATMQAFAEVEGKRFLESTRQAAKRLGSLIALNGPIKEGCRWYNRTLVLDAQGSTVMEYSKVHLTDSEHFDLELTPGSALVVQEFNGIRFGFATCFDLYFAEHFSTLAQQQPDVIISPSYQRSESPDRIRYMSQTRALDCGAYLVRSSYAMPDPGKGGNSLIVAPNGEILANAGAESGVLTVDIDCRATYTKPASHGAAVIEHRTLVLSHRKSELYHAPVQPRNDSSLTLCAHRGLSKACPENTVPALMGAIAVGANEIEFDVRESNDGVPVICHDLSVDRTTNGSGNVAELDWGYLSQLDAGSYLGSEWEGVRIPRLEEIIALNRSRVAMNVHVSQASDSFIHRICDLLKSTGLAQTAYLSLDTESSLSAARDYMPELARACLTQQNKPEIMIANAIKYGCQRIQFLRSVTQDDIELAHDQGLLCNLFWSDELAAALSYVDMGIDVVLTNCAHVLLAAAQSR